MYNQPSHVRFCGFLRTLLQRHMMLVVLVLLVILVGLGCSKDGVSSDDDLDPVEVEEIDPDAIQIRLTVHTLQYQDEPVVIDEVVGEAYRIISLDSVSHYYDETVGIEGCELAINGYELLADSFRTELYGGSIAFYGLEDTLEFQDDQSFNCTFQIPQNDAPGSELYPSIETVLAPSSFTFHAPEGDSTSQGEELDFYWDPALKLVAGGINFFRVSVNYVSRGTYGYFLVGSSDYHPSIQSPGMEEGATSFSVTVGEDANWCDIVAVNFYMDIGSTHRMVRFNNGTKAEIILREERQVVASYAAR